MNEHIESFIKSKHIAVVGVSGRKFGGTIYKSLKERGYSVWPVHPTSRAFKGEACYASLRSIPEQVDAAVIAVSPANAEKVVEDAIQAGISKLWFQQGADFSKVVQKAKANGMEVVSGKCILMYTQPVRGIHGVHRFIARLFGRL
ncbi:MAG TPA: CoA-binding protein [Candidatus Deferrimicrobium sp.]|nr:CoA-binding protein [Candidatus Deferrimicrobium sp.]